MRDRENSREDICLECSQSEFDPQDPIKSPSLPGVNSEHLWVWFQTKANKNKLILKMHSVTYSFFFIISNPPFPSVSVSCESRNFPNSLPLTYGRMSVLSVLPGAYASGLSQWLAFSGSHCRDMSTWRLGMTNSVCTADVEKGINLGQLESILTNTLCKLMPKWKEVLVGLSERRSHPRYRKLSLVPHQLHSSFQASNPQDSFLASG